MLMFAVVFAGCGSSNQGPQLVELKGQVIFNSEPLSTGTITFIPADGVGGVYESKINNGEFTLSTSVGKKNVSVQSFQPSDKLKGPDGKPATVQVLPPKYNRKTELSFEVTNPVQSPAKFELTSKK
ncbi:hypothetical protein SH668x_002438 [Planctomicrobium sp. SH668]|uniref:hypothetical protein n=1 Tax=Planctomicrobium sp. SH668 TaxID=3448126 RepID=UPI003F5C69C5